MAAAASRVGIACFAIYPLPLLYPGLSVYWPVLAAYMVVALAVQLMIWRDVGGAPRAVVSGLIDLSVLTFLVHRVGSIATFMVAIYFFLCIVNTLLVGRKVGLSLAFVGAAQYSVVVLLECFAILPYGPDAPAWAHGQPTIGESIVACIMTSGLLIASAAVVGVLVDRMQKHQAELLAANAQLEDLSQRDPLTQLFNRRYLMARLESELSRVRRGHALAVVMIDLDRFKSVNDLHGHEEGDRALKAIAESIAACTRDTDVPGRYGGDEFVVLLPDASPTQADLVAKRLVEAVRGVGEKLESVRVTASVGVALARQDDTARPLMRRADEASYRAKQAGGDRVDSPIT